ncbi:rod shape-determining protein RodA [Spirochaetia bacterium 38H-sp]|uniref:Peptidoglycan glycosyltransferase RodA n=1 Tax=Rarispira pelagica TaxID=3141764 RepID=A0ABU9UAN6_9SPIR
MVNINIQSIWKDQDWSILFIVIILLVIGILFIYSSNVDSDNKLVSYEFVKQILWSSVGFILLLFFSSVNYRYYKEISVYIYWANIFLIIITLIVGKTVSGAKAWLGISFLGIQPSEFMKISALLLISSYTANRNLNYKDINSILKGSLIIFFPFILILLQPDLGTALVFIPIFLTVIYVAGASFKYVIFIIFFLFSLFLWIIFPFLGKALGFDESIILIFTSDLTNIILLTSLFICIILLIAYYLTKIRIFYWVNYFMLIFFFPLGVSILARKILKDYQIMRLAVFIDPSVDSKGAGWNIIQSLTAIGSGGAVGKGFLNGTQSHLRYLPQQSTDFIFSIIAEEWGFLGGTVIFLLYAYLIIRMIYVAMQCSDVFGKLLASGIATIFMFHFLVNVGMTMGIMPITGIPLLLLSYGGSSTWMSLLAISIVLNISKNRYSIIV